MTALSERSIEKLTAQGFNREQIECKPFLHLRYQGTDCALMVSPDEFDLNVVNKSTSFPVHGDFRAAFLSKYVNLPCSHLNITITSL